MQPAGTGDAEHPGHYRDQPRRRLDARGVLVGRRGPGRRQTPRKMATSSSFATSPGRIAFHANGSPGVAGGTRPIESSRGSFSSWGLPGLRRTARSRKGPTTPRRISTSPRYIHHRNVNSRRDGQDRPRRLRQVLMPSRPCRRRSMRARSPTCHRRLFNGRIESSSAWPSSRTTSCRIEGAATVDAEPRQLPGATLTFSGATPRSTRVRGRRRDRCSTTSRGNYGRHTSPASAAAAGDAARRDRVEAMRFTSRSAAAWAWGARVASGFRSDTSRSTTTLTGVHRTARRLNVDRRAPVEVRRRRTRTSAPLGLALGFAVGRPASQGAASSFGLDRA